MAKKPDPASRDRRWMSYAVLAALLAWAGLWGLIQLPVTDVTKVIFFVLLFVATVCTAMPPVGYLNARFGQVASQRTHRIRFVRQSVWMGTFVVIAGWLQTRRMLTVTLALILLAVLALTETFLITREAPSTSD